MRFIVTTAIRPIVMAARQLCWPVSHYYIADVVYFFLPLFGAYSPRSFSWSSTNFATSSMVTQMYKIRLETWGSPQKIWLPKTIKNLATCRLDREYLRNATRYRPSNEKRRCELRSFSRMRILHLVNSGIQMAINRSGVSTHTGSHYARHATHSSCLD